MTVLEHLDGAPSAIEAVEAVAADKRKTMLAALARLERDGVIRVA